MSKPLPVILFLLGMVGCNKVQSADLTGTWVMKHESLKILPPELQRNSAKIVLAANGTFVASELPGLFHFPPERAQLDSGSGVWKLVLREGKQQVQFDFQAKDGKATKLPFSTQMDVSKGWSSVSLYYFLGDPDEAGRISFERK